MRAVAVHCGVAFAIAFTGMGQPAAAGDDKIVVTVTPSPTSPTTGIQEAIDALGPNGGLVTIPPGEYLLRQAIRVHSGVTLAGAGEKTILRKNKQVGSKLTAVTTGTAVQVEDATGFQAGDEVGFFDRTTVGWLHGHAIVKEVRGNQLLLNKNPGGKFDPANGGAVINYFPAISGHDVSDVVIKDLTIDGRAEENPGPATVSERPNGTPPDLGFTFAAVDLIRVSDSRVENVQIRGWPADGISLQGKGNVHGKYRGNVVTKCYVANCRGPGFHAGGRLEDSEFFDNEARENLGDGFYFCAWVTRITVRNNKFIGNRGSGVGGLGDSGDIENVVEDNRCECNGTSGISLWNGEGNTVRNNICLNNSQREPGRWSGISLAKTENSIITGNRCFDDQPTKTQKRGIEQLTNCRGNTVFDNDCRGNLLSEAGDVPPRTIRIAGIVLKWVRSNKEMNYRRAEPLIRDAAKAGAQIVCTTECFLDGYAIADKTIPLEDYRALGESIPDGLYYRKLAALARELKIHLIAGMTEAEGQARYNTAVLIDPDGNLAGKYRKQMLDHESVRNTPGKESIVHQTRFGRVGIMICADRRFAEVVRRFRDNQAGFLICPSGGMFGPQNNDPLLQARSKENQLFIVFVHPCLFLVTGPDGSIVERRSLGDALLITEDQVDGEQDQKDVYYFDLPLISQQRK